MGIIMKGVIVRLSSVHVAGICALMGGSLHSVAAQADTAKSDFAPKVQANIRAEMLYQDNGLQKATGYTPPTTTELQSSALNFLLHGKVNPKTSYTLYLDALNNQHLIIGSLSHWFNEQVGLSLGKMNLQIGGWDVAGFDFYNDHVIGNYVYNLPFHPYQPMAAVHFRAAGEVTLQLFNDVVKDSAANLARWNTAEHLTYALGWTGQFGMVAPKINYGSYDNNKSFWLDLGVKVKTGAICATFDYFHNSDSAKKPATATEKAKGEDTVKTAISLKVAYEMPKMATPWFYYSMYDAKQPNKDIKFNTGMWDDNSMTWGVGADLTMLGDNYTPFVAVVGNSGKFQDPTDANKTETKSEMTIKLGAFASI